MLLFGRIFALSLVYISSIRFVATGTQTDETTPLIRRTSGGDIVDSDMSNDDLPSPMERQVSSSDGSRRSSNSGSSGDSDAIIFGETNAQNLRNMGEYRGDIYRPAKEWTPLSSVRLLSVSDQQEASGLIASGLISARGPSARTLFTSDQGAGRLSSSMVGSIEGGGGYQSSDDDIDFDKMSKEEVSMIPRAFVRPSRGKTLMGAAEKTPELPHVPEGVEYVNENYELRPGWHPRFTTEHWNAVVQAAKLERDADGAKQLAKQHVETALQRQGSAGLQKQQPGPRHRQTEFIEMSNEEIPAPSHGVRDLFECLGANRKGKCTRQRAEKTPTPAVKELLKHDMPNNPNKKYPNLNYGFQVTAYVRQSHIKKICEDPKSARRYRPKFWDSPTGRWVSYCQSGTVLRYGLDQPWLLTIYPTTVLKHFEHFANKAEGAGKGFHNFAGALVEAVAGWSYGHEEIEVAGTGREYGCGVGVNPVGREGVSAYYQKDSKGEYWITEILGEVDLSVFDLEHERRIVVTNMNWLDPGSPLGQDRQWEIRQHSEPLHAGNLGPRLWRELDLRGRTNRKSGMPSSTDIWGGEKYDLLEVNCQTFVEWAEAQLLNIKIPQSGRRAAIKNMADRLGIVTAVGPSQTKNHD